MDNQYTGEENLSPMLKDANQPEGLEIAIDAGCQESVREEPAQPIAQKVRNPKQPALPALKTPSGLIHEVVKRVQEPTQKERPRIVTLNIGDSPLLRTLESMHEKFASLLIVEIDKATHAVIERRHKDAKSRNIRTESYDVINVWRSTGRDHVSAVISGVRTEEMEYMDVEKMIRGAQAMLQPGGIVLSYHRDPDERVESNMRDFFRHFQKKGVRQWLSNYRPGWLYSAKKISPED